MDHTVKYVRSKEISHNLYLWSDVLFPKSYEQLYSKYISTLFQPWKNNMSFMFLNHWCTKCATLFKPRATLNSRALKSTLSGFGGRTWNIFFLEYLIIIVKLTYMYWNVKPCWHGCFCSCNHGRAEEEPRLWWTLSCS